MLYRILRKADNGVDVADTHAKGPFVCYGCQRDGDE